jgi:hypothetical protein
VAIGPARHRGVLKPSANATTSAATKPPQPSHVRREARKRAPAGRCVAGRSGAAAASPIVPRRPSARAMRAASTPFSAAAALTRSASFGGSAPSTRASIAASSTSVGMGVP